MAKSKINNEDLFTTSYATLSGGAGNDEIYGTDAAETLNGLGGDDFISGGRGSDTINGGDGNDTIWEYAGDNNLIDGGAGYDSANYWPSQNSITANFQNDGRIFVSLNGGFANQDILSNVEYLHGSLLNDTINGSTGNDAFNGQGGNDDLRGNGGDDNIAGGDGNDYIDAGAGNDLIISDGIGADNILGGDGNDNIWLVGGSSSVINGGNGNDAANYWISANSITANFQNDGRIFVSLNGRTDGNQDIFSNVEYLHGSLLNDTINGGTGNDAFNGQGGNDDLHGNGGDDNIAGGDGNDYIDGGAGNDLIISDGIGTDNILGGEGNDNVWLVGGSSSIVDGGIGYDSANYWISTNSITANYQADGRIFVSLNGGSINNQDTLSNIEYLYGTLYNDTINGGIGNDTFDGIDGNDMLNGNDGDDTIYGRAGSDSLSGGAGNDNLYGGAGDDNIDGGTGIDWVRFEDTGSVTVNLLQGKVTGSNGNDTIANVENIFGTTSSDILIGNDGNNEISGGAGDDIIIGRYGEDHLNGNGGIDTLNYDIDVGSSPLRNLRIDLTDTSYYDATDTRFNGHSRLYEVDNNGAITYSSSESFFSFENVIGWKANDFIIGNNGNNRLNGVDGNDTLTGNGGNDTFIFSNGADRVIDFQNGVDHIEISSIFGATTYGQLTHTQVGANTVITIGANSLTLNNFLDSNLDSSDFFFVA